jgi:hypothetical protein
MALVQHWKLDDNAASTTVVATVGTNGTLLGGDNTSAKTTAGPGGSITSGFDLNAVDDAVDISGASLSFAAGSAFSVNLWTEFDLSTGRMVGNNGGIGNSRIAKTADTTIQVGNSTGTNLSFTVASLGTTLWRHILVTKTTGNSMRVFVDGVESSSGAQAFTGTFAPNRLGVQGSTFHDGKLAWVKVFDDDQSANVAALYAEGVSAGGVIIPVFMHHYQKMSQ